MKKAEVAVVVIKSDRTREELAQPFGVLPKQIQDWKRRLVVSDLSRLETVFIGVSCQLEP
jgi:hypothetical protein